MSLKNIILKSVSVTLAISIVFGNIYVCGIGISKAIAENVDTPDINIELQNERYVQYKEEENTGVTVQSKLSINSDQTSDNFLPTTKVELEVKLPSLNGILPERAIVAEVRTKATTGEELNTSINQNYDSNSGLLIVSYENTANDEGKIYTEFNKDAKDEFEIIYIYPEQAYTGNEKEVKLEYTINAKMTFKTENSSITSQNSKNIELTEKENKEDIEAFNITKLEKNIYKGFLYSNVENKTNYDTEYKNVSTLSVLNSQIAKELTMELKESEFVLNDEDETKVSSNGKIEYKATGVSKYEFDKMLGQDGVLEIYNGETLLATVKYIEVEENKKTVRKLAVVYSEDNIRILSDGETTAIVEYPENVTNLKIKTSKPITEGFIHFENQNVIKASEDYEAKVEKIKYLSTESTINEKSKIVRMELKEPETKISVNSSNTNFSTLQTSKTTLTIKLDDTNESTKLFNNPTITVKLPEGLIGGKITSKNIVNGNGLKIKSSVAKSNIITIELEGKQTAYDLNNVSGGANIVMDIEDIDFSDTTPTHKDKIEVSCVQGIEKVETSCNININSKYGLLMISSLTGYNENESITTMDSTVKKVTVEKEGKIKTLTQSINIINNHNQDITDVNILGKLQYSDNNVTSTFVSELLEIKLEGAKIYYSDRENPNYADESWKEEYFTSAKSYKIVLDKISKESIKNLELKLILPSGLGYNASEYLNTEVYYTYNTEILTTSSIIGIETEKIQNKLALLSAQTAQLNIDTHVESGAGILENKGIVYEGQVLKYITNVQNISGNTIENVVLKGTIPDGTIYTKMKSEAYCQQGYFDEDNSIKEVLTKQIALKPNETYTLEYEVRVNKITTETSSIQQNSYVYINGEENHSNSLENVVYKSEVQLNMKFLIPDEDALHGGETAEVNLELKNLTSNKITGKLDLMFNQNSNIIGNIEYDTYVINGDTQETSTRKMPFENIVIEPNETIYFIIMVDIKDIEDEQFVKTEFKMNANFNTNNKTYISNAISKELIQSKTFLTAKLEGYINNKKIENDETIKNETSIVYKLSIENTGMLDAERVEIKDKLPKGLIAKNIKYTKYIKTDEGYKTEETNENLEDENDISLIEFIPSQKILTLYITCYLNTDEDSVNNVVEVILEDSTNTIKTNEVKYMLKVLDEMDKEDGEDDEHVKDEAGEDNSEYIKNFIRTIEPANTDETTKNPNKPAEQENPNQQTEQENPEEPNVTENRYYLSGLAWLDDNKNGKRDTDEKLMDSVIVTLINKETGKYVIDEVGNKITATTNSNGEYKFENITEGNYLVLFEFDTNTYTVTNYQKSEIEQNLNSDAIITTVSINGNKKLAGITDDITLNANKENIDIGLMENATFDLRLEKQITKVTVINSQGTEEFNYKDGDTAKVDLVAKYMNTAEVIVNYKFTITNLGEVTGYVNTLVDNLPSGLEFSSELNKDWYKGNDGQLYTTSLSGIAIKPGETSEIELILTKNMTEENTGTFVNNAELEKISNLENIQEKQNALDNNQSSATLFISIKTGSAILYTGITIGCILILAAGAYIIKKKILDKEEI